MKKCLVTGGAGFIGSHLAHALSLRGDQVVILDNLSSGKNENIEYLKGQNEAIRFIQGDICDPKTVASCMQGIDIVFHQAAVGSVPKSVADPMGSHMANATGTLTVLMEAKKANVKRFVNAASSSAYGDTPELPKRESMVPNPFSPYAATKLMQEHYCRAFYVSYGLESISLRYFNVYGSRQDPHSQYAAVIPNFFYSCLKGIAPKIYGDGEQTRDFTYVEDVVRANLLASEIKEAKGEVVNIAGGKAISINELVRQISELTGFKSRPTYLAHRTGDIRHSLADVQKAKDLLGFVPNTSLDAGLRKAEAWYREQLE